jgi:Methylmalonyl-CoA mutase
MSIEVNHAAWIEKIKTELKGRDLHSFDYEWDGEKISPFEEKVFTKRILSHKENNAWRIGVEINETPPHLNPVLLKGLELGANTFHMHVQSAMDWKKVFKHVHLDWITSEFQLDDPLLLHELVDYLSDYPQHSIKGICWLNSEAQTELFSRYHSRLPDVNYLTFQLNVKDTGDHIARKFNYLIEQISILSETYESSRILDSVAIKITAGEDLVLNISMMRALRLVWMQVLNNFKMDPYTHHLFLSARIPRLRPVRSDQMISASLLATSMIIGGADALFIADPDSENGNNRWGLMTQHILREEAMLFKVFDPFAGSYVIERLTGLIAEKVWNAIG